MKRMLLAFALPALIGAAPPPRQPPLTMGALSVQMYLYDSGRLSRNIAPPAHVDLWNVGAGSLEIGGSADDALMTVVFSAPVSPTGSQSTAPVVLTARNAHGVLGTYAYPTGAVYVAGAGDVARATLWLHRVQCAGRVTFSATYGAQRKQATISFDCGE